MPEASRPHAPHVHAAAPATATPTHAPAPRHGFWSDLALWRHAAHNTWHCLLGCLLGDIAVMAFLPLLWPEVPTPVLFGLAIVAGIASSMLLETLVLQRRAGMGFRQALKVAWGMSLISMVAMELAMNLTDWVLMGGARMPITHLGYWLAWIPSAAVGFIAPLPYNYLQLRRHGRTCH